MLTKGEKLLRRIRDNNRQFFSRQQINQELNQEIEKSASTINALSQSFVDKTQEICDPETIKEALSLIDSHHNHKH